MSESSAPLTASVVVFHDGDVHMANLTAQQRAFINSVAAAALRVAPSGVPAWAPVAVAQALLESNWGKSAIGGYNLFGIKARSGEPSVVLQTKEFIAGVWKTVSAAFRKFYSLDEALAFHRDLILTRRSSSGALLYGKALENPRDPVAFARSLQGVYATDPKYGDKLVAVLKSYDIPGHMGFRLVASAATPTWAHVTA